MKKTVTHRPRPRLPPLPPLRGRVERKLQRAEQQGVHLPEMSGTEKQKGTTAMTETYKLNFHLIKRGLSLDWLIDQLRRRKCNITLREIQDVYAGIKTGTAAEPILTQAMTIIDDYDKWLAGVSA